MMSSMRLNMRMSALLSMKRCVNPPSHLMVEVVDHKLLMEEVVVEEVLNPHMEVEMLDHRPHMVEEVMVSCNSTTLE